jgi:hypothetical protein
MSDGLLCHKELHSLVVIWSSNPSIYYAINGFNRSTKITQKTKNHSKNLGASKFVDVIPPHPTTHSLKSDWKVSKVWEEGK